jgi:site-specific recombinase XerD
VVEPARRLHAVQGDLEALRESWVRALRAANKAPKTIRSYEQTLRLYTGWLASRGHSLLAADIRRDDIRAYLAEQIDVNSASTAATRYRGLQQFFRWACDPDEAILTTSPMAGMSPPHIPEKPVPLAPDQALIKLLAHLQGHHLQGPSRYRDHPRPLRLRHQGR